MEGNNSYSWFSISPDDRWLVFMEIDSVFPLPPHDYEEAPSLHFVTLDLESGKKTHHNVDQIPPAMFDDMRPWNWLRMHFRADSWRDGVVYIDFRDRIPWVSFTPGVEVASVAQPRSDLRCSDCGPSALIKRRVDRLKLAFFDDMGAVSIPFAAGHLSPNVYTVDEENTNSIVRIDSTGHRETLVTERRIRNRTHILRVRASPDERYVAYVVGIMPIIAIPFAGYYEVYLLNLRSGARARVDARYGYTSRPAWSSDSKYLYYAAINRKQHGIYRVDVGAQSIAEN